jgi:hypothetical protein
MKRDVRVPHADEGRVDRLDADAPSFGVFQQVFVERIAGRAVHKIKRLLVDDDSFRQRQTGQILHSRRGQHSPVDGARGGGQPPQPGAVFGGNPLRHGVIVIAADSRGRVRTNPIDARQGIGRVIDQVAEEQANVVRFLDRGERGPIRMDVGQQQNLQRSSTVIG